VRKTLESIQWGLFCTSSWTWCIGMYLPFIMLRLWGWPGFWAFFVPNVVGCAMFGFVLDRDRSRALAARLGWACALFSAVTVAYQCWFAGWIAQTYAIDPTAGTCAQLPTTPVALRTIASTAVPNALLLAGLALALRGNAFWRTAGTVVTLASPLVLLLPGGLAAAATTGDPTAAGADPSTGAAATIATAAPILDALPLVFALPTIVAGFLLSPYLDLTFHRAAQEAPNPRIAFATFGAAFAGMLLLVASFHEPATGAPRVGLALLTLWGVQLLFTISVHLRELLRAPASIRMPAATSVALIAAAVLLGTPAFLFNIVRGLLPGEPLYLTFLGAYGLLFPVLFLLERRPAPRAITVAILFAGVPCYLLGAWDFMTVLMPVPIVLALWAARRPKIRPA
jgi:hypothetical protein